MKALFHIRCFHYIYKSVKNSKVKENEWFCNVHARLDYFDQITVEHEFYLDFLRYGSK